MGVKQPRSVQIVVFAETGALREFLLLQRIAPLGGFWQPVTGSLEAEETHLEAAIRELKEETGIQARVDQLIDLGLVNTFEIAPHWRGRYAPGVTHNEEVCFAIRVDKCEIRIDPVEHQAFEWVDFARALEMLFWKSNKRAFEALARKLD